MSNRSSQQNVSAVAGRAAIEVARWGSLVLAVAAGRMLGEWIEWKRFDRLWRREEYQRVEHVRHELAKKRQQEWRLRQQQLQQPALQEDPRLEGWRRLLKEIG